MEIAMAETNESSISLDRARKSRSLRPAVAVSMMASYGKAEFEIIQTVRLEASSC